jgi:hypothetical protein
VASVHEIAEGWGWDGFAAVRDIEGVRMMLRRARWVGTTLFINQPKDRRRVFGTTRLRLTPGRQ